MKAKLIKSEDSYILKDGLNHVLGIDDKKLKDRLECPYLLSKQNCDELFGVVDVEKLARNCIKHRYNKYGENITSETQKLDTIYGFKDGFNKAMELNKDKVFTLEDLEKAYLIGCEYQTTHRYHIDENLMTLKLKQQPTEIEVEIEMQCLDPTCDGINRKGICIPGDKPKLDSQGCLILKKI
jgi:hypothetical protein